MKPLFVLPPLPLWLQRWLRVLPWLILAMGGLISWNGYQSTQRQVTESAAARFQMRANELISELEGRIDANADVLRGVAGLFASSQKVTRQEFRTYIESLQLGRYYPGIQGVGYALRFNPHELAQHEAQIRAEGLTNYQVRPRTPRDTYSSIVYLEPFDWRNQRAFGYDMFSEEVRQQAMRRSALSGEVAVSGLVTLVQETEKDVQPGFLMYAPVYRKHMTTVTPEQRWQALEGWTYTPVRSHDLINAFLKEFSAGKGTAILSVFSGENIDAGQLLYGPVIAAQASGTPPRVEKKLQLYGTTWLLVVQPRPQDWLAEIGTDNSILVLYSGLALTFLLATLVAVMMRSHRQVSTALAEAVNANERLAQSEATLRLAGTVMEASSSAIIVTDAQRKIVMVNPAFNRITGYTREDALGKTAQMLISERQSPEFYQRLWDEVHNQGLWEGELQSRRKNGELYPAELSISRVNAPDGSVSQYVGLFTDITSRRRAEERVRFLALHDYLTGLPNRALLMERATQELASARRYGRRPALLFLDLDRFKPINDTYGHETGDAVLRNVAHRLRDELRESDLVCRQGGDEFVVLLPDHVDHEGLSQLAGKLLEAIERPHEVAGARLELSACIGVATYPENGDSVDALIESADSAMYLAKSHPEIKIRFAPTD